MAGKVKGLEAVEESLKEAAAFQERDPWAAFEAVSEDEARMKGPVNPRGARVDPMDFKRGKFISGIQIQIELVKNPEYRSKRIAYREIPGESRRRGVEEEVIPSKFHWTNDGGKTFMVECRYGRRIMELGGAKVRRVPADKLIEYYELIIQQARAGALDKQIKELSTRDKKE